MIPRVVVTGVGAVSSAGPNADALADAVASGRSCLSPVADPRYHRSLNTLAGLVTGQPRPVAEFPAGRKAPDRFVLLALAAADEALRRRAFFSEAEQVELERLKELEGMSA